MADKSFGIKELNLIGASGTPTITSPNNLNLNASNVAISTDVTIGRHLDVDGHAEFDAVNVSGVSTFSGITTVPGPSLFTNQLSVSGISTFLGAINVNDSYGTSGQVLTSQGSGSAPQWASPVTTTNVANLSNPAVNDVTVTGIPASATNIVIALANVSTTSTGSPVLSLQMGNGSMNTADYYWVTNYSGSNVQSGNATSSLRLIHTDFNNASNVYNGIIHISESNGRMAVTAQFGVSQAAVQISNTGGCWAGGGTIDRIRLFTSGDNFDNGRMSVHSW